MKVDKLEAALILGLVTLGGHALGEMAPIPWAGIGLIITLLGVISLVVLGGVWIIQKADG